jgi:hypothetical protein
MYGLDNVLPALIQVLADFTSASEKNSLPSYSIG